MSEAKKGNPRFLVNVDKVLKDKNPELHRKLPRFIIRWFEKLIYQEPLNDFLREWGHVNGKDFSDGLAKYNNITIKVKGQENIPSEGRFTFASNHPLGGVDGMMLCSVLERMYPDFKFLVNDILMNVLNLEDFFLPINKHGAQAKDAAKYINEVYASERQIGLFPAGLVSRLNHGEVKDLEWKKNFIAKSIQHKRDIIPLHITGENRRSFYRIAKWRKRLGIKANLEMLFLPGELMNYKNKSITITFGKPIKYTDLDRSKSHIEWAQYVKEVVYNLAKEE